LTTLVVPPKHSSMHQENSKGFPLGGYG
jgi:hypothetical protein